jgi:hypothetical protein
VTRDVVRRWLTYAGVLVLTGSLGYAVAAPSLSSAATASTNRAISVGDGDVVNNYDYRSKGYYYDNVDWAVSVFFTGNAEIDKVKDFYDPYLPASGGTMYAYLKDGSSSAWDKDGGIKTSYCSTNDRYTNHLRLYADGDDRMYNLTYGYYVFGTTHLDHAECGTTNKYFGESETVEGRVVTWAGNQGMSVTHDTISMNNNEPYRVEGNHRWSNNAYASRVRIP